MINPRQAAGQRQQRLPPTPSKPPPAHPSPLSASAVRPPACRLCPQAAPCWSRWAAQTPWQPLWTPRCSGPPPTGASSGSCRTLVPATRPPASTWWVAGWCWFAAVKGGVALTRASKRSQLPRCPYPSACPQEDWLAAAFGGGQYSGPDPAACAAEKGMAASHINALAAHVTGAMSELGMPSVRLSRQLHAWWQMHLGLVDREPTPGRPPLCRSASRRQRRRWRRRASAEGCPE